MKKEDLVIYEAPTITEFISWGWLQDLVARYIAWTVNRKWDRYQYRLRRNELMQRLKLKEIINSIGK